MAKKMESSEHLVNVLYNLILNHGLAAVYASLGEAAHVYKTFRVQEKEETNDKTRSVKNV